MLNNSGPSASPQDKRASGSWIGRKASSCFELPLAVTSCIRTRCKTTWKLIIWWQQNDGTGLPWSDAQTVPMANHYSKGRTRQNHLFEFLLLFALSILVTLSYPARLWPEKLGLRRPERHSSALQVNSRRLCLGMWRSVKLDACHCSRWSQFIPRVALKICIAANIKSLNIADYNCPF